MNTSEILNILEQDPKIRPQLEGVFPRDGLPVVTRLPSAIIANTDVSKGSGEHWVAIYFPVEKTPMYFDSYGLAPRHEEFSNCLQGFGKGYDYNDIQLQNPFSSACGQYSIFFLAMACRGCSMKQIQNCFSEKNLVDNDLIVTEFVNRNYKVNTIAYDLGYIIQQVSRIMNENKSIS